MTPQVEYSKLYKVFNLFSYTSFVGFLIFMICVSNWDSWCDDMNIEVDILGTEQDATDVLPEVPAASPENGGITFVP